jgi:hypothetical protein
MSDLKEKSFLDIPQTLPLLLSWYLDGKDQPVTFTYYAQTSTLSLEKLSLNIGADWEVHIT